MREIFYEESALIQDEYYHKTRYNLFNILSWICYGLAPILTFVLILILNFSTNVIVSVVVFVVVLALLIAGGAIFGKQKNKFYIEYDYTFISGTIRISKVYRQIKRKFLFEFETRDIEKLGRYKSSQFYVYENSNIETEILTLNKTPARNKSFYYIVANVEGLKKMLVLECSEKFIVHLIQFSNQTIIDDDLRKEIFNK